MTTATAPATALDAKLSKGPGRLGTLIFVAALLVGVLYVGVSLTAELPTIHGRSVLPFVLLGVALLVALGFEFVNGFHDTANAVATVPTPSTLRSRSSGPAPGIFSAYSARAGRSRSGSSRSCRWS